MPGWHEKIKDLVAARKLVMLGVVQEQHAERARLFANWKGFEFPILHDPINLLGCNAVPITMVLDSAGVVRSTRPTEAWLRDFVAAEEKAVSTSAEPGKGVPDIASLQQAAQASNSGQAWRELGDAVMLWKPERASLAIEAYRNAVQRAPSAELHFRLGVAHRQRSESADRQTEDFSHAVSHWATALAQDPNQYIWRRRIQQYGPRLDKPYPFYDWVEEARAAITQRDGRPPAPLLVPLSGAEIAEPAAGGEVPPAGAKELAESPDPSNRIHRDLQGFVEIAPTIVAASRTGESQFRLHLQFSLGPNAVWNNESEPLQVWFETTKGVIWEKRRLQHQPVVNAAESNEVRVLDVEFTRKNEAATEILGFALYYVCEKESQQCILRRQDFKIPIRIE